MRERADIVAAFDRMAAGYDRAYDAPGLRSDWLRSRLTAALDLLGDGPGTVLDAGMGPGRLLEELERRGWTAWGVDGSSAMAARARERAPDARERIFEGRLEALPFPDEAFDAVVAIGVMNYAPDPDVIVRELARVLRPGGRAVIAFGNGRSPFRLWRELAVYPAARALKRGSGVGRPPPPWRKPAFGRRGLRRLLSEAGLEPETYSFAGFTLLPDPVDRLFPRIAVRLGAFASRGGRVLQGIAGLQVLVAARKGRPRTRDEQRASRDLSPPLSTCQAPVPDTGVRHPRRVAKPPRGGGSRRRGR